MNCCARNWGGTERKSCAETIRLRFFRASSSSFWKSAGWIPTDRDSSLFRSPPKWQPSANASKQISNNTDISNRMRILKVVQSYFPFQDRGGPVVKVRALARGLAKRGHQITVLTADLGGKGASNKAAGLKFERNPWGWRNDENGVQTVYLSSLVRYRALTLNPHVIGFCRASISQFDLVHLYGLYDLLGPAASYFCRRHSVPYVIEPMGMYRPIDRSL